MTRDAELEKAFDVTPEQLATWDQDASRGEFPGKPVGSISVGRPRKFGDTLKSIGFKETERKIEAIDHRAASLGMKRSDYLRYLVDKDLAGTS